MKRDDFGMRIDEIRELATKYSKGDLARMVKMGMLDPQRALMAGMMIDRIAKSAMTPPQTTVVEDVLAAPTTAQGQIPAGIMGAPQAPVPSPGVAGLPSGMQNMAGGGIVAFAEGGDTDDIPGYAGDKGSVVDAGIIDKIDPNWRSARNRKVYSSEDKFAILAEQLRELQSSLGSATGEDKRRIEGNIAQLQQEMRRVKPSRVMTGLESLIPSAEAAAPQAAAPAAPEAPAGTQRPKTARERLFEQQVLEDYGIGPQTLTPEQQKESQESAKRALDYQLKQKQLQQIEGGMFSQKPLTEQQASEAQRIRSEMERMQTKPTTPVAPAPAAPAAPSKFDVQEAPAPRTEEPAARAPGFERPGRIEAEQLAMPQERTAKELYKETEEMYGEAGVNTNLYKEMMQELREKKVGLKDRREQALGLALMSFGVDLAGAREGQEFERLGSAGQRALGMYMNSMDKIVENEDKIEALQRQVRLEENNYRRTGADSALARRDRLLARADNIAAKNAELKQDAAKANSQILADVYKTDVYFQARTQDTAARMAAALGANKGGFTEKQLSDLYDKVEMENRTKLEDLYKDKGSKEKIEQEVKEKLLQLAVQRAKEVAYIRQKGGIPVPSSGGNPWQVTGGVD